MNSIIRCTIENFQSHENSILDFGQGLNVIVGPSDHGKSAVIRAIKWVLYNEPRGIEFIRNGANAARVSLEMSNGYTIVRERSKSKNRYEVISPDEEKSVFEGFGNEIPEEVIKAHGIPKVILDEDITESINIGDQLEGPFLLSSSGAVRAKALGRLSGVHIIDRAIRNTQVDFRRENQTAARYNLDLGNIDKELEEFRDLELISKILTSSEKVLQDLDAKNNYKQKLHVLSLTLNAYNEDIALQKEVVSRLDNLDGGLLLLEKSKFVLDKMNRLIRLFRSSNEVKAGCESSKKVLDSTKELQLIQVSLKEAEYKLLTLSSLNKLRRQLNELKFQEDSIIKQQEKIKNYDKVANVLEQLLKKKELHQKLLSLESSYKDTSLKLDEGQRYIETVTEQLKKNLEIYTNTLKEAGKCPFCKSSIAQETLYDIIKEYKH